MDSHKGLYSIEMMARALNVSPSSYYNYKRGKHTARADRKEYLLSMIQELFSVCFGCNHRSQNGELHECFDERKLSFIPVLEYHTLGSQSDY